MSFLRKYGFVIALLFLLEIIVLYLVGSRLLLYWMLQWPASDFKHAYPRFWWLVYGAVKGHIPVLLTLSLLYIYLNRHVWLYVLSQTGAAVRRSLTWLTMQCSSALASVWVFIMPHAKPAFKVSLIVLGGVVLALGVAEFVLRIVLGIEPGTGRQSRGFNPVKKLIQYSAFSADSLGILRVDKAVAQRVNQLVEQGLNAGNWQPLYSDFECDPGFCIEDVETFHRFYFSCELKTRWKNNLASTTGLDSAIRYYLSHPINPDGFRSIPFKPCSGSKKKVLMLGDSFTWGHTATNFFCSFADILLARGYAVYNTGITATDPVQYQQVALKYVPLLKPDVVVANIYLGNDVKYYVRPPLPYIPEFFTTNAGNLRSDFSGLIIPTADSAYNLLKRQLCYPNSGSLADIICLNTAIGTLIYRTFELKKTENISGFPEKTVSPEANTNLEKIQQVCSAHGARLIIAVIPSLDNNLNFTKVSDFEHLLEGKHYYLSPVGIDGYAKRDNGHFTNSGHEQYANFLQHVIENPGAVR